MVINIDTKGMFIEGNLARESVLYVVVTADLNQTICYWITTTFGDVLCLYQSFNLLRQSSVRRYSAFEENFWWFHLPQSAVLNAFSVLSIPTGDTQNTRDLGTGVPKTRGYPNHCDLSASAVFHIRYQVLSGFPPFWHPSEGVKMSKFNRRSIDLLIIFRCLKSALAGKNPVYRRFVSLRFEGKVFGRIQPLETSIWRTVRDRDNNNR